MQMFEFLTCSMEDAEEADGIPQVPATPTNRIRTCSAQVKSWGKSFLKQCFDSH